MDILDELWESRNPYNALFLEIIEGYEIKELLEIQIYIKNGNVLFTYFSNTFFPNIVIYNILYDSFMNKFQLESQQILSIMNYLFEVYFTWKGNCTCASELNSQRWIEFLKERKIL